MTTSDFEISPFVIPGLHPKGRLRTHGIQSYPIDETPFNNGILAKAPRREVDEMVTWRALRLCESDMN
jgi:hypothetical protein